MRICFVSRRFFPAISGMSATFEPAMARIIAFTSAIAAAVKRTIGSIEALEGVSRTGLTTLTRISLR